MTKHKVCVVTGTRAEYGLLRLLIKNISKSSLLQLQIVATGMHLSPEFGLTKREIEADDFSIDHQVEMLLSSDTTVGITKSTGLGIIGFADAFNILKPDSLLILGDRYEIFASAFAALIAHIPIIHLHGGELTEGAFDDAIRHSLSKMAHFHFVAAEEYRKRIIQMGEDPSRVFCYGGLGVDAINQLSLLSRHELEKSLDFELGSKNLLITFHPVTLEKNTSVTYMTELLAALREFPSINLLFTMPNADTDGRVLFNMIHEFCSARSNAKAFTSLGQLRYFSCIRYFDGVVGNSSSGIAEVPSFKKGTINIGDRQKGRLKANSVIDCLPNRESISSALHQLFSLSFQSSLQDTINPYGTGGTTDKIIAFLEETNFKDIKPKSFYDLEYKLD